MIDIFNSLADTSLRTKKLEILNSQKNNQVLKEVFRLSLDPLITFGIKKMPAYKKSTKPTVLLEDALPKLNQLIQREVTGNAAQDFLKSLLESLDESSAEILTRVISKNPKCGVADATVNSIWPNLIIGFPIMKATAYDNDHRCFDDFSWPAISQEKLDGARCCAVVDNGKVTVLSSSGREIMTDGLFDWLANICNNVVVDGELMVTDDSTGKFASRKKGNGIVTKAIRGTISQKEISTLRLVTFDLIPLEDWKKGIYNCPYIDRLKKLNELAESFESSASVVETKLVNNVTEALLHFKYFLSRGLEGTIVKDQTGNWADERSPRQVKLKDVVSCDLEVMAIVPGTGKYTGMIGSLLCRSADGAVVVNVGSGLSDKDRTRTDFVGKIVEVLFNEKLASKDPTKPLSLFTPRFNRIRYDKDRADTIDNIPGATRFV